MGMGRLGLGYLHVSYNGYLISFGRKKAAHNIGCYYIIAVLACWRLDIWLHDEVISAIYFSKEKRQNTYRPFHLIFTLSSLLIFAQSKYLCPSFFIKKIAGNHV